MRHVDAFENACAVKSAIDDKNNEWQREEKEVKIQRT